MSRKSAIVVFTHIPSPYQVELFNAIALKGAVALTVCYLRSEGSHRLWKQQGLAHESICLDGRSEKYDLAESLTDTADLVVFNYYQNWRLLRIIKERSSSQRPWCFWGERPGYHGFGGLGSLFRRVTLGPLLGPQVPIWGMGTWAVESYRKEFGSDRTYFNVPYFSELSRFDRNGCLREDKCKSRRFLFSGSLIKRKGVDLLASAFSRLADELDGITLSLVGEGSLRPALETELSKYGARVQFLGFQEWERLPEFYRDSDILCAPSRYDGWNMVIPEGLAAGLPVISTTRTGAALELIKQGTNGWLVEASSPDQLYKAMREAALMGAGEFAGVAASARESVSRHSLADGVDRFIAAVGGTLNGHAI